FLIPLFFVLHGYAENYGYISFVDCLILIATYAGAAAFIYFVFLLIFRNSIKAALFASYLFSFFCFFGAFHDFLLAHSSFLYKYTIILPAFLILAIILFVFLKITKLHFVRTAKFLNILLLIYLIVDSVSITRKIIHPVSAEQKMNSFEKDQMYTFSKSAAKPDIYFLLFDEYESSSSLKKKYNYNNSDLDTFLINNQFRIQANSTGNYMFTPLSLSSILNMSYLRGVTSNTRLDAKDFVYCANLIRDNEVVKLLSANGYEIVNYSIFDLVGKPSQVEQSILPIRTRLITCRTLFYYMKRDIGWMFYTGRFKISWLVRNSLFKPLTDNNRTIELVRKESLSKNSKPRFIYAHILMPHYPFFYDSTGKLKSETDIYREADDIHIQAYLDYLPYTNARIRELISDIK
ncbi:MAG: hypothetical protein JST96_18625, partial [Bacteroidetes bacterium]|nr:hypothetical protein [Bacteroidota bacterium]